MKSLTRVSHFNGKNGTCDVDRIDVLLAYTIFHFPFFWEEASDFNDAPMECSIIKLRFRRTKTMTNLWRKKNKNKNNPNNVYEIPHTSSSRMSRTSHTLLGKIGESLAYTIFFRFCPWNAQAPFFFLVLFIFESERRVIFDFIGFVFVSVEKEENFSLYKKFYSKLSIVI